MTAPYIIWCLRSLSSPHGRVGFGRGCAAGTGRLRALARASLWGMVGGLAVSVPMFYFLGLESVVPSIIAYVLVTNLALMSRRVKFPGKALRTGLRETWQAGRHFIMLGIYMTATDVIAQVLNYVFIAWLNQTGGENSVGLLSGRFHDGEPLSGSDNERNSNGILSAPGLRGLLAAQNPHFRGP